MVEGTEEILKFSVMTLVSALPVMWESPQSFLSQTDALVSFLASNI